MVFGGMECGHIDLLHGNDSVTMPHPCRAHAGLVTNLFGSTGTSGRDVDGHCPSLVSYGSDEVLNVWAVELQHRGKAATAMCGLRLRLSVEMAAPPLCVGMLQTTVLLALGDNHIVGVKVPTEGHQAECLSLSSTGLLTHQTEDDHTGVVTSISCCRHLGLFATSGGDGGVKVWDIHNQLVSEVHFGPSLTSVCFANARGDLLIGLHRHVCIFYAEKYLPPGVLELVKACPFRDSIEEPIPFDSELEFW